MTSDRSTDRVPAAGGASAGERHKVRQLADGCIASAARRRPTTYLTTDRLAALDANLDEADWAVLETVHRFGFVSGPQLAQLHFGPGESDGRAARRTLARLRMVHLLDILERRIGGVRAGSSGHVYRLGQAGVRLLTGSRRTMAEPGLHHLRHTLAVVDVLVSLRTAERSGAVQLLRFDPEPDCWRSFTDRYGEPAVLKPDAYCELRVGNRRRLWFVEVDRGTVSTATLKRTLARYGEYLDTGVEQATHDGVFPRVVWVTATERRAQHLRTLCVAENHRLGAELHRLLADEWAPP